jgi:hypothetical protein
VAEQRFHELGVGNVAVYELEQFVAMEKVQVGAVPSVGQRIKHNNAIARLMASPMQNEIGADETRTAGDEKLCHGSN